MVVAYSTQADQVAVDGAGRNSPFTAALVKQIAEPGLEIGSLFRRVAADVNRATGGRQFPELSISLLGEFYFNRADTDLQAWSKIRGSQDGAQFKTFLDRYPLSPLVYDARERLEAIERTEQARIERDTTEREKTEQQRQARDQAQGEQLERERLAREEAQVEVQGERERLASEQVRRESAESTVPSSSSPNIQTAALTPSSVSAPPSPLPSTGGPLVLEIKRELKRVGCYFGRLDDRWGTAETAA
jgi:hypothetical protein